MRVNVQAYSRPGLLPEHPQDSFARRSEDPDTLGGLQRLGVGLAGTVTHDAQMEFEGSGVRMYLDDCHLAAFLVDVLVERDQPRLMGLDEAGQRRDTPLPGVESAVPEPVGGDEDERSGPCGSLFFVLVRSFGCAGRAIR